MQVGRAGSERQVKAVGEILTDTRRRIYLVLADGSDEDPAAEARRRRRGGAGRHDLRRRTAREEATSRRSPGPSGGAVCGAGRHLAPGRRPRRVARANATASTSAPMMCSKCGASTTPTFRRSGSAVRASRCGPIGMMTAYTPNADDCRACGLCVVACPEGAIALSRAERGPQVRSIPTRSDVGRPRPAFSRLRTRSPRSGAVSRARNGMPSAAAISATVPPRSTTATNSTGPPRPRSPRGPPRAATSPGSPCPR